MGAENQIVVRIVTNIEALQKGLGEGKVYIEQTEKDMVALARGAEAAGAKIEVVGTAVAATTPHVDRLHDSLTAFDGLLASMGVHLGPEVRAIGELGDVSGKTVSQLGLIATAGLAVGAGIGGWKIGRAVSEFFDLDTVISQATAKLFGWGDAAAQAAGAKADALAMASARVGVAVTNMAVALVINAEAMHTWRSNATLSADTVARWQAEIGKVNAAGDLPSLTADLASQNFALKDLAARYGVTVEALQFMTRQTAAAGEAEQAHSEIIKAKNATLLHAVAEEMKARTEAAKIEAAALLATTKLWDEYATLRVQHGGTANAIAIAEINQWAADTEAAAIKAGRATTAFYVALAANSKEKLAAVGVDWAFMRANSIEGLTEIAKNARATYDEMMFGSQHFTRDVMDAQLKKTQEAEDAARGMGKAYKDAFEIAADAAKKAVEETEKLAQAAEDANAALNAALSGAIPVSFQNFDAVLKSTTGHWQEGVNYNPTFTEGFGAGGAVAGPGGKSMTASQAAHLGYGFAEIVMALRGQALGPNPAGPRIPGFAGGITDAPGGWARVGERGPETMFVPPHASIYPSGSSAAAPHVTNIYITQPLGTPAAIAAAVDEALMSRSRGLGARF